MIRTRCLALTMLALALAAAPTMADHYMVDPAHTSVVFKIKHLDVSYVFGRFDDVDGHFMLEGPHSHFEFTAKVDSVDTNNKQRDAHLRSKDFFHAEQYPEIAFKSLEVRPLEDGYEVKGELTLHGVTRPLTVKLEKTGEADGMKGEHMVGFMAQFSVNRSDFGIDKMLNAVGDDVTLMVSVAGTRK